MTRKQKVLLLLSAFNLLVVFLFPPFDDYSMSSNGAGTFAGFYFAFHGAHNLRINSSFLYLEIAVVLINLAVLWLLTLEDQRRKRKKFNFRKIAMLLIVINLIGVVLFPPFEYVGNMTNAMIPTFEGFYFIFTHPPYRVIVMPVLYLEVFFILINGGLMLLAFKENPFAPPDTIQPGKTGYAAKVKSGKL
jgi:hypothetical protein